MDHCIETRALKESLRSEVAMKTTQQGLFDDVLCGAGINGAVGEDFFVDDLFDFSNEGFGVGFEGEEEEEEKDSVSWSSQDRVDDDNSNSSSFSGAGDFDSLSVGELAVPDDDLEHLEWLSHFVDDSSASELSLLCPAFAGNCPSKQHEEEEPRPSTWRTPLFPAHIPAKPRSKRRRNSNRVWNFWCSSPSPSTSSSSSSSSSSCLIFTSTVHNMESFYSLEKPPAKKPKKSPSSEPPLQQRRCSHCLVQKTPQWRTGPHGPKTLCNACGVRFKSGRLFPEYRPACSPTFSVDVHSNSHRKVLEIRRKKETAEPVSG